MNEAAQYQDRTMNNIAKQAHRGEVPQALEDLDTRLNGLDSLVDQLEMRLESALASQPPETRTTTDRPTPVISSLLGSALTSNVARLTSANNRLRSILDRCQL